jgi:hypothetical protein
MNEGQGVAQSGGLIEPGALAGALPEATRRRGSRMTRLLLAPVKLFWGMAFCQGLTGGILVIGWTYRLAQRSALKYWWACAGEQRGLFRHFLAAAPETSGHQHWPNWFFRQNARECLVRPEGMGLVRFLGRLLSAPFASIWDNFWIGLRGIFTTWTLTLPAGVLWWFGWYDGWNNSFNKGYEQAPVGPLISVAGIFLFIAVMFYVPLAQARQAVTGEWRLFYGFRLIWSIVRLRWLACAGLALLYAVLALPLSVLKTVPMFFLHTHPEYADLAAPLVLKKLDGYFFWCGVVIFPAFVVLRLVATRIYASGVLQLAQSGRISGEALSAVEANALGRLGLMERKVPATSRPRLLRLIAWTGTRFGRTVSAIAIAFIWYGFTAQIYITEFLDYHGALGWLNQPLVQLPWFHYVPARLKNPGGEVFFAILLLLVFWLVRSVTRVFTGRTGDAPGGLTADRRG